MRLGIKHFVVAALVLGAVTGCSLATDSSAPSTTTTKADVRGKVGQELTVTNPTGASAQATVVSVVDEKTGKTDADMAPANGQYAVITMRIKGVQGSFDVNALNVQYQAADGKVYDETSATRSGPGTTRSRQAGRWRRGRRLAVSWWWTCQREHRRRSS